MGIPVMKRDEVRIELSKMPGVIDLSKNLRCINQLLLPLRDEKTDKSTFVHYARRLMRTIW